MLLRKWEEIPDFMKTDDVRFYFDILQKKKITLFIKRSLDIIFSGLFLVILSPFFLIFAIAIKLDSKGPVFYRQERVTAYGQHFKMHKFRSMIDGADKKGSYITVKDDERITRVGKLVRKLRFDEFSQLIDIFSGKMSFVGTRPEVPKFTEHYTSEMNATFLLPAGLTSNTSLYFSDEAERIENSEDAEKTYIEELLPEKMEYNLYNLEHFSLWTDIKTVGKTALVIFGKTYKKDESKKKKIRS